MGDTSRFSQSHGIVPMEVPLADNYNAGVTFESVDMSKYNHLTFIMLGSDSVAGAGVLTIYGGATDGAQTAALTFTYRYSGADAKSASADVYGVEATSAALTLTEASVKSGVLVAEIDAQDLVVSGTTYRWVTPVLSAAGTAGIVGAVAILSEPRYEKAIMLTAI